MQIYAPKYNILLYSGERRELSASQTITPWGQSGDVDISYSVNADQTITPWGQSAEAYITYGVAVDQLFTPWAHAALVTGGGVRPIVWLFDMSGTGGWRE